MNAETGCGIVIVAVFAVGIGLWGMDFFLGAAALFGAVIAAVGVRDWRRAGREIDQAVALVCKPCNGDSGRCTCSRKCGHWLCGAADTGIRGWTDDEIAYLQGKLKELPK